MSRFLPLPKSPRVAPLEQSDQSQDDRLPPPVSSPPSPPSTPLSSDRSSRTSSRQLIWNRIVFSILAIALLWGTSLNASIFFTEHFVRIPPAVFPIHVCRTAARKIQAQATSYEQCAARQMATCDIDLDDAAAKERARSQWAQEQNVLRLDMAEAIYRYFFVLENGQSRVGCCKPCSYLIINPLYSPSLYLVIVLRRWPPLRLLWARGSSFLLLSRCSTCRMPRSVLPTTVYVPRPYWAIPAEAKRKLWHLRRNTARKAEVW